MGLFGKSKRERELESELQAALVQLSTREADIARVKSDLDAVCQLGSVEESNRLRAELGSFASLSVRLREEKIGLEKVVVERDERRGSADPERGALSDG